MVVQYPQRCDCTRMLDAFDISGAKLLKGRDIRQAYVAWFRHFRGRNVEGTLHGGKVEKAMINVKAI